MDLAADYARLYAFAVEATRVQGLGSADAASMGVKNALVTLKFADLAKPDDVAASLADSFTVDVDMPDTVESGPAPVVGKTK